MTHPFNEFSFIESIRHRSVDCDALSIPIGDDAAGWEVPEKSLLLMTVDMLMEGVHFTLPAATPQQVGFKVMGVNLSDIAAMAAVPQMALVSIATPRKYGSQFLSQLQNGMQQQAEQFGVTIIGGDTNIWNGPLVVSVTLLGSATHKGAIKRKGAQAGDWILTTGTLGGSLSGKHLDVKPRINEALLLHEQYNLHAMIDISDGLVGDLFHILDESKMGAELLAECIPISKAATLLDGDQTALEHALSDGEDFELLFTLDPQQAKVLIEKQPLDIPLTHIGFITKEPGCLLRHADGTCTPLDKRGWEHSF